MKIMKKIGGGAIVLATMLISFPAAGQQAITERPAQPRTLDMAVQVNQVGFHPGAAKFCMFPGDQLGTFEIIDAVQNELVFRSTLIPGGPDLGAYTAGDFTALETPGVYYARVGDARSFPFRIGEDIYDEPMKLILSYFAKQRCGASTTGYLTPCHTEDGIRIDNGQRQDVSGGWHDASDLRKWVSATIYGMVGILGMAEALGDEWGGPAVTEELQWGNRYFLAMQEPSGYVMKHVGGDVFDHSDSNHWTDNILNTADDRLIETRPVDKMTQFNFVNVQARMAEYMKDKDVAYARRCRDAAVRGFEWGVANIRGDSAQVSGSALLAALALHRATGMENYKQFARKMADQLLTMQVGESRGRETPGGFFRNAPGSDTYYAEIAHTDFAVTGLCKLVLQYPEDDNAAYISAIRRYCEEYLVCMAEKNAFAMLPYEMLDRPVDNGRRTGRYGYRYFMDPSLDWWVGNNCNITSKGVALVLASRILNDAKLKALAQRQLDWVLGANPLGTATMRGVGYEHPAFRSAFYADWERPGSEFYPPTPHLPGAVLNGIGGDEMDMPVMPDGYWQTGEYWTPMVGHTLWLMAELTVPEPEEPEPVREQTEEQRRNRAQPLTKE